MGHFPNNLEVKFGYKKINARYYLVPTINKEIFRKELLQLVEKGVLNTVQQ